MLKRFAFFVLGLVAALSLPALAQNITRSVQLSLDPTGIFGVDTNNSVYFSRHINSSSSLTPALTTCGTSPSIVGTDLAGSYTTGGTATTCTITFATAYVNAPACLISAQGTATQPTYTVSNTAITVTVDIAATAYNYLCIGVKS